MEYVKDPKTGVVHCTDDSAYRHILQKRNDDFTIGKMQDQIEELKRLVQGLINN